jgi:hypothetical protein
MGTILRGREILIERRGLPRSQRPQTLLPIHSNPASHPEVSTSSPTRPSQSKSTECLAASPLPHPTHGLSLTVSVSPSHTASHPLFRPPKACTGLAESLPKACPNLARSILSSPPLHPASPPSPSPHSPVALSPCLLKADAPAPEDTRRPRRLPVSARATHDRHSRYRCRCRCTGTCTCRFCCH